MTIANRFPKTLVVAAGALCVATGLLVACSDDDKTSTPAKADSGAADSAPDTSSPASDIAISLAVTYNGTQKGPILASAWATPMPGPGTPAGSGANDTPTLPGTNTVRLKNVKPGHYFVFAYVMVGPDHRTGPVAGDPVGPPTEVDVVDGKTSSVAAMLFDPMPDAGKD